jgi:hypothetical protein
MMEWNESKGKSAAMKISSQVVCLGKCAFMMAAVLLPGACERAASDSNVKHNWSDVSRLDTASFVWHESERDKFVEELKYMEGGNAEVYEETSPAAQRIQAWMDVIHEEVKKIHGDKLKAPRPRIALVKKDVFNAYVRATGLCLNARLEVTGNSVGRPAPAMFIDGVDSFRLWHTAPRSCVKKDLTEDELLAFVKTYLPSLASCATTSRSGESGVPVISLESGCLPEESRERFQYAGGALSISYPAIVNYVTVYDKLMEMGEGPFIAVLTHELGHYYKAHGLRSKDAYDYFYQMEEKTNLAQKPAALPEEHEIAILGKKATEVSRKWVSFYPVPGQKLHTLMFKYLKESSFNFTTSCERGWGCSDACNRLNDSFSMDLNWYPEHQPFPAGDKARAQYQEYERYAAACFKTVEMKYAPDLLQSLDILGLEGTKEIRLDQFKSFEEVMNFVNEKLPSWVESHNNTINEILSVAATKRVGFYTVEQEADDLSLELVARLGLKPETAVEVDLELLRGEAAIEGADKAYPMPGDLNYKQCAAAYDKGFPEFIPIGDYSESHHGTCFRAYNLYRELKAHRAEIEALSKMDSSHTLRLDPSLWSKLREGR